MNSSLFFGTATNRGTITSLPAPCAWCAKEDGIEPSADGDESHTVCARHYCMTLLLGGNIPAQMIKDRAVRMYGMFEGCAAFDTAVRLVRLQHLQTGKSTVEVVA